MLCIQVFFFNNRWQRINLMTKDIKLLTNNDNTQIRYQSKNDRVGSNINNWNCAGEFAVNVCPSRRQRSWQRPWRRSITVADNKLKATKATANRNGLYTTTYGCERILHFEKLTSPKIMAMAITAHVITALCDSFATRTNALITKTYLKNLWYWKYDLTYKPMTII